MSICEFPTHLLFFFRFHFYINNFSTNAIYVYAYRKPEEPQHQEEQSDEENDQFSTIKRSPKDANTKTIQENGNSNANGNTKSVNEEYNKESTEKQDMKQMMEDQLMEEIIYGDLNNPGIKARALYDYQAGKYCKIDFKINF